MSFSLVFSCSLSITTLKEAFQKYWGLKIAHNWQIFCDIGCFRDRCRLTLTTSFRSVHILATNYLILKKFSKQSHKILTIMSYSSSQASFFFQKQKFELYYWFALVFLSNCYVSYNLHRKIQLIWIGCCSDTET